MPAKLIHALGEHLDLPSAFGLTLPSVEAAVGIPDSPRPDPARIGRPEPQRRLVGQ
jgi:hypothetical protein